MTRKFNSSCGRVRWSVFTSYDRFENGRSYIDMKQWWWWWWWWWDDDDHDSNGDDDDDNDNVRLW